MVSLPALERLQARVHRRAEVRAAARDDADLDRVQALAEGALVERQRALHERAAGERDESGAVALELRQQVLDGELCPPEAVRLHVRREHAPRRVERDDQVDALAVHLLPAESPHGPGECEDEGQDRAAEERRPERASSPIDVGRHHGEERRGDEGGERALAASRRPDEERRQQRHEQQRREARRVAPEDHGSFRSTVSPSAISASTRPSAGHTSQAYSSR